MYKMEAGEMCFTRRELQEAISHPSSAEGKLLKRFSERSKKKFPSIGAKSYFPPFLCVLPFFALRMNQYQRKMQLLTNISHQVLPKMTKEDRGAKGRMAKDQTFCNFPF